MEKILIVNIGSSSKRYALYQDKELFNIHIYSFKDEFILEYEDDKLKINELEYKNSLKLFISRFLSNLNEIKAIGIRVVCPGKYFLYNKLIDYKYIRKLEDMKDILPLHIIPVLEEIKNIKKLFPKIKLIGISDSSFHKTISEEARHYAIGKKEAEKYGIHRYGYHGISVRSVLDKSKNFIKAKKIIVCHIGSGVSLTAIENYKSLDNSMGFTPLEGIFGGTRVGDIDPGAVIYLSKKLNLEEYFNHKCGFSGLTGKSDIRELLNNKFALNLFSYRIKKYIGSYIAVLNGLDLIIFTGAVGENSSKIRELICKDLDNLGINLNKKENLNVKEGFIHSGKVKILVLKTNEMEEIYRETLEFI